MKEGEFPQKLDLQLYPHMINITQGGLCTGSSMSNYGPTVSWLRANTMPKTALTHHTHGSCGSGVMSSSPRFHDFKPTTNWEMAEVRLLVKYKQYSWHQLSRNTVGTGFFSLNKIQCWHASASLFNLFKVTHFYQTHNDAHDLTGDNYSMSTFAIPLRADADSSPSLLYKNFRDSVSSHVCLFIIYLSPDIQEVASQASHKSCCLSRQDPASLLDFQLLLVNQNSIL